MGFTSLENWINENSEVKSAKAREIDDDIKEPSYGCVMMESKIKEWEDLHLSGIEEDDLYEVPNDDSYGLEETPHVTIIYGIHEDEVDPEVIAEVIEKNMEPTTVIIDEIGIFEGEEYDVVKYNVPLTEQLQKYRDIFLKFPNTQTFPDYHPHMTIAYVKPGLGKKYAGKVDPFEVTFTKGVYSWHEIDEDGEEERERKIINLETEKEKVNESVIDNKLEANINDLRRKYPEYSLNISPSLRFKNAYSVSLYKGSKYIAGVRGPCSLEDAYAFFKNNLLRSN